ncbi:MAG: tetratricopeptide repeat protein [Eubacteriales bacterium]|nr:tetratricopeptide repeat protein [Eubacteriales bacterium]
MKSEKKPNKRIEPKILLPAGVGGLCIIVILVVILFVTPQNTTAGQLQKKLDLGNKYLASAEYDKAEVAFSQALEIDKKSPDAALGLAEVYNEKKEPEKALEALKIVSGNMEALTSGGASFDSTVWKQKKQNYSKVYDKTQQLFIAKGDKDKAKETAKQKDVVINIIVEVVSPTGTPVPEAEIEEIDKDDLGLSADGSYLDTPDPLPEEGLPENVTPTPEADTSIPEEETQTPEADIPAPETSMPVPEEVTPALEEVTPTPETEASIPEPAAPTPERDAAMPTPIPEEVTPTPDAVTPTPTPDAVTPTPTPEAVTPTPTPELDPDTQIPIGEEYVYIPDDEEDSYSATQRDSTPEPLPLPEEPIPDYQAGDRAENSGEENNSTAEQIEYYTENNEERNAEKEEMPAAGETAAAEPAADVSPEDLLRSYADNTILAAASTASFSGADVPYDYSNDSGTMSVLSGILGMHIADFNGDGVPEMLVVSMQSGRIGFDMYKVSGNDVSLAASSTVSSGFGNALDSVTYGGTQECFIRDNGSTVDVGTAEYYFGADGGDGNPAAKATLTLYNIAGDGSAQKCASVTIVNGTAVYSDGNFADSVQGGKDSFIEKLAPVGLSGAWISESADTLAGMDLLNNPLQDMAGVPDPLSGGLAGKESGVQDLVIVKAHMPAGSGSMNMSIEDNSTF